MFAMRSLAIMSSCSATLTISFDGDTTRAVSLLGLSAGEGEEGEGEEGEAGSEEGEGSAMKQGRGDGWLNRGEV